MHQTLKLSGEPSTPHLLFAPMTTLRIGSMAELGWSGFYFFNDEIPLNFRIVFGVYLFGPVMTPHSFRTKILTFFVLFMRLSNILLLLTFNLLSFHSCMPYLLEHFLLFDPLPFQIWQASLSPTSCPSQLPICSWREKERPLSAAFPFSPPVLVEK